MRMWFIPARCAASTCRRIESKWSASETAVGTSPSRMPKSMSATPRDGLVGAETGGPAPLEGGRRHDVVDLLLEPPAPVPLDQGVGVVAEDDPGLAFAAQHGDEVRVVVGDAVVHEGDHLVQDVVAGELRVAPEEGGVVRVDRRAALVRPCRIAHDGVLGEEADQRVDLGQRIVERAVARDERPDLLLRLELGQPLLHRRRGHALSLGSSGEPAGRRLTGSTPSAVLISPYHSHRWVRARGAHPVHSRPVAGVMMEPAAPALARTARPTGGPRLPVWAFAATLALTGVNLRDALRAVPPLLPDIAAALRLSGTSQGLLTSVMVAFMGLSAPVGHKLAVRMGPERATALALGILAAGCTLRLVAVQEVVFLASSAVAGIGMGGASALIPGLIAHHAPRIRGFAMGLYSTGLALGATAAAWVALPTERWLAGWRPALAIWGGMAALTCLLWLALLPRLRGARGVRPVRRAGSGRLPWRSPTAWWVTWFMSANMLIGFSGLAWVTPYYVQLGATAQRAAAYFVVFQAVQVIAILTLPWVTDVTRDRQAMLALCVLSSGLGIACLLVAPLSMAIPAMCLFGLGVGGGSTLALVLLVDTTSTQADAARLSGMVMLVAFLAGASGPALLGVLRDLTGTLVAGYAVVLGLTALLLPTIPVFRPGRTIDDARRPEPEPAREPAA